MSRVEITGQFAVDGAILAGRRPYAIDRPAWASDTVPSWNKFCDAVDAALAPLSRSKAFLWIFSCGSIVIALALAVLMGTGAVVHLPEYVPEYVPFAIFAVLIVSQMLVACHHQSMVMTTTRELGEVCAQCSGDGVVYALKDEPMSQPGCSTKRSICALSERKYFITVEVDAERGAETSAGPAPQGEATTALESMLNEPLIGKEEGL